MKKVRLSTTIALIILAVFTTINGTLIISYKIINYKQTNYMTMQKRVSKLYELMNVVDKYFVGTVTEKDALDNAAAGYISGMGDKWSYYLTAEQFKEYQQGQSKNLVGIGINVVFDEEKQAILVTNVFENSPAFDAGIQKLDLIVAVDDNEVASVGYTKSVDLVKGENGSQVKITVLRNGNRETLSLKRKSIEKVSVNYQMIEETIGYVQITEFDANTSKQFKTAIDTLKESGAKGFIFDVRNNPGGFLTELVDCLDILLPKGDIISTVSKDGVTETYSSDEEALEMPIVVLANENSISAGEFFPAAIQEYGVGKIIGKKTQGKGYSQQPVELSDGSAIILSTNKYYTPSGKNLAETGIEPDISVELTDEQQKNFYYLSYNEDPQFKRAIEEIKLEILK